MKRKLLSLLILALLPLMASADAVQIDGIYYNLDAEAKTAEVTSNPDKYSGSISIPETVFNYNDGVKYDVTSIGDEAFRWCHEITSIVFPTQLKLKSIGFAAMYACSKLTSVVLPEGLVSIGQKAFTDCTSLESVTVPSTVTKIDPSAFNGCPSLTSFICKIETPLEIKESVFGDRSIITLYVPEGCKDAYVNSEYWQGFKDIVEGGEGTNLCPDSNHPHMIDLGLPSGTKWSCCNVGADKPEAFGGYYAWGETEEKEKYSWETYLLGDGSDYGANDIGVDIAGTTYDVAYVKQGSHWRMPTLDQMEEMTYSCTSEWTTLNDVKGLKITGSNGNSIFLPAAGEKYTYGSTDGLTGDGVKGHYWTSNCQPDFIGNVRLLNFAEDLCGIGSYGRSDGITVRAVASSSSDNEDVIAFADAKVKAICVENWDTNGDGELSYEEAAAITDLGEVFKENKEITSFEELQYFTGLSELGYCCFNSCSNLKSIIIPKSVTSIKRSVFPGTAISSLIIPENVAYVGYENFIGCNSLTSLVVAENNKTYDSRDNCNAVIEKETNTLMVGCNATIIPSSVTAIGENALNNCKGLTNISLPEGLTQIGIYAFCCTGIKEVTIPQDVQEIGYMAFYGCENLTKVISKINEPFDLDNSTFEAINSSATLYVPAGTKDKYLAAEGWNKFQNIVDNLEVTISDYEVGDVFTVDGMTFMVTSLDPLEVRVGKGELNGIGVSPAIDTSTEGTVKIPSSVTGEDGNNYAVTTIGAGAFSDCSNVTSVAIPNSVTAISGGMDWGDFFNGGAFENCGLTSLVIPASVTSIGSGAFAGCGKLKSIVVEEGNTKYDSRDNCNAIIRTEDNLLIAGCEKTVVPDGVTGIGACTFKNCSGLASLVLPGSLTSIGQQAFEGCSGLTSVVIPEGVTCIWQGTFNGCSSLTTMTIPKGMKWIGRDTSSGNFWSTFGGCESLTDVYCYAEEAPEVTASVFKESNIANATLYVPTGCKDAYAEAEGWKDFKEIVEMEDLSGDVIDFADENVEAICLENWDTNGDGKLSYEEAAAVTDLGNVFYSKNITSFNELQYFTGLTAIGEMAFHFSNITSVKFPTSLLEIGAGAFDETAIESIDGGVTKNDFVFPNHITTLRGEAFAVNDGIHSVTIPASVTLMEPMCFRQCPNLTSFTIDEANPVYKMVDGWVIENGTKMLFSPVIQTIESLVVPEGITEIARRAGSYYGGVSGVKTVMLPASLKKIGYSAFYNLTKVVSNSTEPAELEVLKVEDRTFYPFDEATFTDATLYVPAGTKDKYLAAEGWKKFAQIVEVAIEEEVIYIPNEEEKTVAVDTSDKSATEVEIFAEVKIDGEKYEVTAIGEGAFENNENLEKVSIPETVESIGDNAFAGCSNLKEIRVYAEEPIKLGSSTAAGTRGGGASTVFAEVDMETCVLYVPAGSKEKYEQAEGWKDFTHIVEMGEIMEITIGKNGKTTFCGDKGLDFSGTDKVKAFIATGFDKTEGIIWMTRVKDVPAQVPVMIKGTAEKTYKVPVTAGGTSYYENMFKGNTTGETISIGETSDDGTLTNYYMSGGQFKSVKGSANIGNNKCYLQLPTNFEAETTGEALSVKIADSGKSSFAAPYDLDFTDLGDDLKAFTATGYDASTTTVWLTRVKKVQKGEGLMLKGKGGVTYTIPSTGVQAAYENMIVGNTGEGITIYETSEDGEWTNYYLKGGTYMKVSGNANIGKNKSYLQLPTYMLAGARSEDAADMQSEYSFAELETESMPIIFASIGGDDDETTGIRTTDCTDDTDESRAAWYTLGGQRISQPTKPGLYIRNGRKVVIRSTTK